MTKLLYIAKKAVIPFSKRRSQLFIFNKLGKIGLPEDALKGVVKRLKAVLRLPEGLLKGHERRLIMINTSKITRMQIKGQKIRKMEKGVKT